MIHQLRIPGFENRDIKAETNSLSGRSILLVDGQPASPGPKRGQFLLRDNEGRERVAAFKSAFPDTVPTLVVDGTPILLAAKLQWYELVWACFPLVLILLGGLIGGLCGGVGAAVNTRIFRSEMPKVLRYVLAAMVTFACFTIWIIIGSMLQSARAR
ncbi:MAG TPA: hypothetical protein VF627_13845 [Abditibacterium sp.]